MLARPNKAPHAQHMVGWTGFTSRRVRMFQMPRCKRPAIASRLARGLALGAALALPSLAEAKTITAVMHSDPRVTDPIITTAYITRDQGDMIYDTLLATHSTLKAHPEMAES